MMTIKRLMNSVVIYYYTRTVFSRRKIKFALACNLMFKIRMRVIAYEDNADILVQIAKIVYVPERNYVLFSKSFYVIDKHIFTVEKFTFSFRLCNIYNVQFLP